jgi:hypothetical protein
LRCAGYDPRSKAVSGWLRPSMSPFTTATT